jgi:DedD protein
MSSLLMREEEEESREPDITLSTASLLALFLGLVLVCGVFFGFGYSVGRRTAAGPPASAATANTADGSVAAAEQPSKPPVVDTQEGPNDSSSTPNDLPVVDKAPTPAADQTAAPAPQDTSTPDRVVETLHPAQPAAVTLPVVQKPAAPLPAPQQAAKAPAKPAENVSPAHPIGRQAMVQVAAVVHQEDAEALVSGLRKHGYNAVIRTEPQDKLLHVQVGPFPDRVQANAMRQKLLSSGYAAIVKQ